VMNRHIPALMILTLLAIALSVGCSSSGGDSGGTTQPPPYDADENIAAGWSLFQSGDFDSASALFADVIDHEDDNAEAYLGSGWSDAFRGEYSASIASFLDAINNNLQTVDAHMGLAAVYRDLPNFDASINYASAVLSNDANYVFSKRTSVNYKDAHLIIAQAHFRLGGSHYDDAHERINMLLDMEGLDTIPDYGSMADEDYEQLLATKLEELSDLLID